MLGIFSWSLVLFSIGSLLGLMITLLGLLRVFKKAPRLGYFEGKRESLGDKFLTVVIPAYNEAENIESCLNSVLSSCQPCRNLRVLLVDDGCEDKTVELAIGVVNAVKNDETSFEIIEAGPRPAGERWVGKNWACSRAMEKVKSPWVLFIDADVRLEKETLRRALSCAIEGKADLLSLAPRLKCGCLTEWMVQPIMASLLALGFPIKAINDPSNPSAFAAGPFMLFRTSAYYEVGGHAAISGEVVEDLVLARRIKSSGFKLIYLLGLDAVELKMYSDFSALWEGWSKNWFLGLDRNILKSIGASFAVFLMFSGPWMVVPLAVLGLIFVSSISWFMLFSLCIGSFGIALQFVLRLWTKHEFQVPIKYWWLMGFGGLIVGAIGPVSAWRTITGRGWTWKGRPLG